MSIRAGSIVTVMGRNVVDRLQSAGLDNANVPVDTIREIGNDLVVDKIPGDPDFTFSMQSWDVSTDILASLQGKVGDQVVGHAPGYTDADHTEYKWENCQFVNVVSPWKTDTGSQGGHIGAGLIIPGYYPTQVRYSFGLTDNAAMEVQLAGGAFYYAAAPSVEEVVVTANGTTHDVLTSESARALRVGGSTGTTFQRVFGVLVNGVLQVKDVDYVEQFGVDPDDGSSGVVTLHFINALPNAGQVKFCYFTETAKTVPQAANADATVKPGAVRGRNIVVKVGVDGSQVRIPGVQSMELTATIDGSADRELGNSDVTGRTINGTDVTGTLTFRPKDKSAFFDALSEVTGVATDEVFGWFNQKTVPVDIEIQDPKNPGTLLKTLRVADGQFQPPGTPARVNQPTDFAMQFNSVNGSFSEYKKGRP